MRRLSSVILLIGLSAGPFAQSPHGPTLTMDCAACHKTGSWEIPPDSWDFDRLTDPKVSEMTGIKIPDGGSYFNHYNTAFPLTGRHVTVDCRTCHASLVFPEAETTCVSCHTDLHNQTVGADCARCHNAENWLVNNISELHQNNGFPLLGAHQTASCTQCHISESALRFERIGNDCINCHSADYAATTTPNHAAAGYSTECSDCHNINSLGWFGDQTTHDFFPLTKGHDIADCARCHTNGYQGTPTNCAACHTQDYNQTRNPNHQASGFSTDCAACHTTDPDWRPATFDHDDQFFPIYSGNHRNEWNECSECHTTANNYSAFSCIICHEHNDPADLADEHDDVQGYSYTSSACYSCHPKGN